MNADAPETGPETGFAELVAATNYSFLRGASHPAEMVARAIDLGMTGIGIADRNSVAGVVRAQDAADVLGTPVDVDLDDQFGVYAVGFLPVAQNFEVLGRVGWAQVDAAGSFGGFSAGVDDDGLAAGLGVQWGFTPNFGVRGEYTRMIADNDDQGIDAWTLSGVWAF